MQKIEFNQANRFERGSIYKLLYESYAKLLEAEPDYADEYKTNWRNTDDNTFDDLDSTGNILISTLNDKPIGFVSWYPKAAGEGEIGHNCIVPSHRSKGYGKQQIQKALGEFPRQTRVVQVTIANHPFFIPAQKTYISCGFIEVARSQTDAYGGLELIHYEYKREQAL